MFGRSCALVLGLGLSGVAQAATFYIDATAGDDTRNAATAQTATTPWKTLTRALTATELLDGDTVRVATGAYGAGETFPLPVKSGVTVAGAGPGSTVITVPEGATAGFRGNTSLNVDTVLRGFGLVFGGTSVYSADAFRFDGSSLTVSPTINTVSVGANFNNGVSYAQTKGVLGGFIYDSTFIGVQRGIDARTHDVNVAFQMDGNTIHSSNNGVRVIGTDGYFTFTPTLTGSSVSSDVATAVYLAASLANSVEFSPRITGNEVKSDAVTGAEGLHGQVVNVGTIGGASVVAANTVSAKTNGIYWWLRTPTPAAGTANFESHVVANTVTNATVGVSSGTSPLVSYDGAVYFDVSGNAIAGTRTGVAVASTLRTSTVAGDWLLAGNSIASNGATNGYGLGLTLTAASNAQAQDVLCQDNIITGASFVGLTIADRGAQPEPLISGNNIVGNPGAGLRMVGVTTSSPWISSDVGGGSRSSSGLNTLMQNGLGSNSAGNFDLINNTPGPAFARNNYWGTTDAVAIDARIKDNEEAATSGAVDFGSPLSAQPTAQAVVNGEIAVINDLAPIGVSPGDTIRITATIDSEGLIGCAAASVEMTGGVDGATYTVGSAASPTGFATFAAPGDAPTIALGWLPAQTTTTASWDAIVDPDASCAPIGVLLTAFCGSEPDVAGAATADRLMTTWYVDGDGDTYGKTPQDACSDAAQPTGTVAQDGDCDDTSDAAYPGAPEVANDTIDQDCNGVDSCFSDGDEDAHGTATLVDDAVTIGACTDPGESTLQDDCDDTSATVFPGAPEVANDTIDQDCDSVDSCYADGDLDNHGTQALVDDAVTIGACTDPGESTLHDDCDDTSDAVFPGAPEVANDTIDQDCNSVDSCFADVDLDDHGTAVLVDDAATIGVCTDPGESIVSDDCKDDDNTIFPGAVEIRGDGIDQDCDNIDPPADTGVVDTDTAVETGGDADTDADSDADADTDTDFDTDTAPCDGGGGAAGGGGCCKPQTDTNCAWIVLPFLPIVTLRRRRSRA